MPEKQERNKMKEKNIDKGYNGPNWYTSTFTRDIESQEFHFIKGPNGEDLEMYAFLGVEPTGTVIVDFQYVKPRISGLEN
ncbi:hypothetical protein HZA33_02265 [Candidatus Pacearchaeota archaeon]|nr:hypothetical protein [Candidatus Pacearchaeota archaeon]